jgi:hypothetical protein
MVLYFDVKLSGQADAIHFKVYTKAMTAVLTHQANGLFHGGWNQVAVPLNGQSLASGLYYVVVESGLGSLTQAGYGKLGKFVYIQ